MLQLELYPSQIHILKSLSLVPQNVSFFGDKAFKDKVKWAIYTGLEWTLIQSDWCTMRKFEQTKRRDTRDLHAQRKVHVGTQGEDGHLQVKKGGFRRNQLCGHLDPGFLASEL